MDNSKLRIKLLDSDITSATYFIKIPTPRLSLSAGSYEEAQTVEIENSVDADIYYTTDGSEPTQSSTLYTDSISINISQTLKVIAIKDGLINSNIVEAVYEIFTTVKIAAPIFYPIEGIYESSQTVTITCDTSDTKIYYTLDGSTPTKDSFLYFEPVTIMKFTTLKAVATKSESLPEENILNSPIFIPSSGEIS